MRLPVLSNKSRILLGVMIGSVWIFHGLYSKILHGVPRHQFIVGRVLGEGVAVQATIAIGLLEMLLGIWVFSGRNKRACALMQTLAIAGMNTLEIFLAKDLLISASGMLALNLAFLALVWFWATSIPKA